MSETTIKVLLVDDQQDLVDELRSLLQTDPQIQVIGTACDGFDALQKMQGPFYTASGDGLCKLWTGFAAVCCVCCFYDNTFGQSVYANRRNVCFSCSIFAGKANH